MEQLNDTAALPTQATKGAGSTHSNDHDVPPKLSGDAEQAAPETDYSSKAANKTSFTAFLVNLPSLIHNLHDF